jgi:F-type H+-transporting ATPase subunit gamma
MPSLIDLRRRIRSVKNTQQITKAMKMVAAARLRRAQDRVVAARPYALMLTRVLANVAHAARSDERTMQYPLLQEREPKRIQLLVLTSDRGLAGAFNSNIVKGAVQFIAEHPGTERIDIEAIGRKGRDFFRRRAASITGEHIGIYDKAAYADASSIARKVAARYSEGEIDAVYLIFQEFKSVISQRLTIERILPVALPEQSGSGNTPIEYIYEQPAMELLEKLLPRYVEMSVFRAILESASSEHAARMTAMDAATSNAADVIAKLTLYMNRVRQASITREIIEVVSGAAALE